MGISAGIGIISFLISGANEIVIVQVLLCFGLVFLMSSRDGIPWRLLLPFGFFMAGVYLAISAPGNFVRMNTYSPDKSLFSTLCLSLGVSAFLWFDWLFDSLLIPGLLILSYLYIRLFSHLRFSVLSRPNYWFMALLALCPVSLFPLLFASGGTSLPERIVDLLYLNSCILACGFIFSLLQEQMINKGMLIRINPITDTGMFFITIFVFGQLFFGGLSIDRTDGQVDDRFSLIQLEANIGLAYLQLLNRVPQQYSQEMLQIEEQVKNCKTETCCVPPLSSTSFLGYDPLYDRIHKQGETGMPVYLNSTATKVLYCQE